MRDCDIPFGDEQVAGNEMPVQQAAEQSRIAQGELQRAVVGTPAEAMRQLRELAARWQVDEVMLNPVASTWRGSDPGTTPGRESTLRLLAELMNER